MRELKDWEKKHKRTSDLLRKCKAEVDSVVPGARIILYGSRARGDATVESDYDLLVILPEAYDTTVVEQIRDRLYDLDVMESVVISVIIKDSEEWNSARYDMLPWKQNILRDGVLLKEKVRH